MLADLTHPLAPPSTQHLSVLLVDDSDSYASFVRSVFRQLPGSDVTIHHRRRLADILPLTNAHPVSVILLDVDLPDGNGLRWLRAHRAHLQSAVIVLTSFTETSEHDVVSAAAQDYLVKSQIQPEHLVRAVRYAADRESARQELLRSREYFQSLIEHAADLITVVDDDATVVYQSPAIQRLLDRDPRVVTGVALSELVVPEDRSRLAAMLALLFDGGDLTPRGEFQLLHADGSVRTLDVVASRVPGNGGRRQAVLNSRDVTERRRAEEALRTRDDQLRQAMKMEAIGRLAGGIAHDFCNVLTVIIGACERLQDSVQAQPDCESQVATILSNCRRAASLTRQLLAFSRQQQLSPQPLDLGELVGRAGHLLQRLIGEHIALDIDIAAGLPAIEADPVQMEQVLMNLTINARDAMPGGGTLLIRVRDRVLDEAEAREFPPMSPGRYVVLEVSDTGCGMSADTRARAFEPFFTTKGLQGTGLGLSTAYGIVKQSGGFIWMRSAEGAGTSFTIFMPPTADAPLPLDPPRPAASRPLRTGTILLTEDDTDVRDMLAELLKAGGHTVLQASDADAAIARAQAFDGPIDLLLTDVVMPGGSGRELARRIVDVRPELKILYMSGYPEYGGMAAAGTVLEPGLPFLAKPFTRDVLLRKIDELLA